MPTREWWLSRTPDGWGVWPELGAVNTEAPAFLTSQVPHDDQNAAFDWAGEVTPDVDRKSIHYFGPPPT